MQHKRYWYNFVKIWTSMWFEETKIVDGWLFFWYLIKHIFQHISSHIQRVPACYDRVLYQWDITPQVDLYYTHPTCHIILTTGHATSSGTFYMLIFKHWLYTIYNGLFQSFWGQTKVTNMDEMVKHGSYTISSLNSIAWLSHSIKGTTGLVY